MRVRYYDDEFGSQEALQALAEAYGVSAEEVFRIAYKAYYGAPNDERAQGAYDDYQHTIELPVMVRFLYVRDILKREVTARQRPASSVRPYRTYGGIVSRR